MRATALQGICEPDAVSEKKLTPRGQQRELTAAFVGDRTLPRSSAHPNTDLVPFCGSVDCFFREKVKTNFHSVKR